MSEINQVISRVCPKCNEIINTSETVCAACGRKMMPASRIKMLGWLSHGLRRFSGRINELAFVLDLQCDYEKRRAWAGNVSAADPKSSA